MVAVNLLYHVGSKNEHPHRTGLAHLMEHLMFTGSKYAPNYDAPLQAAGGESNAWTSVDITNYYETLPAHNIETAFWLESGRLMDLNLSEESIDTQKRVVMEEFKQRCLNQPYGDLGHVVNALAYQVHPYRWPTIGLKLEHIQEASYDEIVAFFHAYYAVNNAILCVSGHIDFDRVVELAEKWFGDMMPHQQPPRQIPAEPEQTEPRLKRVCRTGVPQDMIYLLFPMCGRGGADYQACDNVSDILSNGTSSRFYRHVLVPSGLFTELDASVRGNEDSGLFIIRGRLTKNADFERAKTAIEAEIQRLFDAPPTQHEIEKCVNKYESNLLFENIGYAEKAVKLCRYELLGMAHPETGLSAHSINTEIERYRALTPEKVLEVARRLFSPQRCSVLYYGPNA